MALEIKDRVPTKIGRVKLTDEVTGASKYYTLERADEPVEEGTPLNKATLDAMRTAENVWVSDEVAELYQLEENKKNVDSTLKSIEESKRRGWESVSFVFNLNSITGGGGVPSHIFDYQDDVYCIYNNKLYIWNDEQIRWDYVCEFGIYQANNPLYWDLNEETGVLCGLSGKPFSGAYPLVSVYDLKQRKLTTKNVNTYNIYDSTGISKFTVFPNSNQYAGSYDTKIFEFEGDIYIAGIPDSNRSNYCICKVDLNTGDLIYCRNCETIYSTATYSYTDAYVIRGKENKLFMTGTNIQYLYAIRLENLNNNTTNRRDIQYIYEIGDASTGVNTTMRDRKQIYRGHYCIPSSSGSGIVIRTFRGKETVDATLDRYYGYTENRIASTDLVGTPINGALYSKMVMYKGYLYLVAQSSSSGKNDGTVRKRFDASILDNIEGVV